MSGSEVAARELEGTDDLDDAQHDRRHQPQERHRAAQRYRIVASGLEGLAVASEAEVKVGPTESRWVAVRLQVPYGSVPAGSHPIHFQIASVTGENQVSEKAAFLVPR